MKVKHPNIIAALLAALIMLTLSLWGYEPQKNQSILEVANSNAYWNFTFFEMLLGFFVSWLVCYSILYKVNEYNTKNSQG